MSTFLDIINILYLLFLLAMIIRAVLSWFTVGRDNLIAIIVYEITEPILVPLRRFVPRIGMVDITPMVAIIIFWLVVRLLNTFLA